MAINFFIVLNERTIKTTFLHSFFISPFVLDILIPKVLFSPPSCFIIPEPTARSAVPGVSPGRGLLIPHGYLNPGKSEHSEVQSLSIIAGASLCLDLPLVLTSH